MAKLGVLRNHPGRAEIPTRADVGPGFRVRRKTAVLTSCWFVLLLPTPPSKQHKVRKT
jgi:hypothetical protein